MGSDCFSFWSLYTFYFYFIADADLLSSGSLADKSVDISVSTFRYRDDSDPLRQVTATVRIERRGIISIDKKEISSTYKSMCLFHSL